MEKLKDIPKLSNQNFTSQVPFQILKIEVVIPFGHYLVVIIILSQQPILGILEKGETFVHKRFKRGIEGFDLLLKGSTLVMDFLY